MSVVERIGVVGLGYVGLPVAMEFARHFEVTVGFDIDETRVSELRTGLDRTGEIEPAEIEASSIHFTTDMADLSGVTFYVVAVPTPVDANNRPDLSALVAASETVGRTIEPGAVVVFESTVYPGATEDICGPAIERTSGLRAGVDFSLGYSPERINPGDREHTLPQITKVVSGQDEATLERVARPMDASSRRASIVPRASWSRKPPRSSRTRSVISTSRS